MVGTGSPGRSSLNEDEKAGGLILSGLAINCLRIYTNMKLALNIRHASGGALVFCLTVENVVFLSTQVLV